MGNEKQRAGVGWVKAEPPIPFATGEGKQRVYAAFLVALFLNSLFAPLAFAREAPNAIELQGAPTPSPTSTPAGQPPAPQLNTLVPATTPGSGTGAGNTALTGSTGTPTTAAGGGAAGAGSVAFACNTSSLTPEETQKIQDALKEGFVGESIDSGTPKNTDREKTEQDTIVVSDDDTNSAVKVKVPNEKLAPQEVSWLLHSFVSGPFVIGLVLSDTMRVGRCKDEQQPCWLDAGRLKYRNSAVGVKENFGKVWDDFFDDQNKLKHLSEEDKAELKEYFELEDKESFEYKTAVRLPLDLIPNSILTDTFEARMETNCTSFGCIITSYSMFDKMYNGYFSAQSVVTAFGPIVSGTATRWLVKWGRKGVLPRLEQMEIWKKFRMSRFMQPSSVLSRARIARMYELSRKHGFGPFLQDLGTYNPKTGYGYMLIKTEEFNNWWHSMTSAGGFIDNITDKESQKALLTIVKDLKAYVHSAEALRGTAEKQYWKVLERYKGNIDAGTPEHLIPELREAKVLYGRQMAQNVIDLDDIGFLDWPEMWTRQNNANFAFKFDALHNPQTGRYIPFVEEHRTYREVLKKLRNDGSFANWKTFDPATNTNYDIVYETVGDDLVRYRPSVKGQPIGTVHVSDLPDVVAKGDFVEKFVKIDTGEFVQLRPETVDLISKNASGDLAIYEGGWAKAGVITPYDVASDITSTRARIYNTVMGTINTQTMYDDLVARGFGGGARYTNILTKAALEEENLIKTYFSLKGGIKWTVLPFAYQWAKRGLGSEDFSAYLLPDSWSDVIISHGDESLYADAYIDFFANEGSDMGDIFLAMIGNLPWQYVLDEVSRKFNPLRDLYHRITRGQYRKEVENLAFYSQTHQDCSDCAININSNEALDEFNPAFFVDETYTGYLFEDVRDPKNREVGTTLITFSHHTNYKGKSGDIEGGEINLLDARKGKDELKTCAEAVKGLEVGGIAIGSVLPENAKAGLYLGLAETMTYVTWLWAGVFSTALQQIVLAPQLQDCVDDQEGYYVHYYLPSKEMRQEQQNEGEISTEKVTNLVKDAKEKILDSVKGEGETFFRDAADEAKKQIDTFVKTAEENDIVQAKLVTQGNSFGRLASTDLFYFWCSPTCTIKPSAYRTEGKEVVRGVNDVSIDADFKEGKLTVKKPDGSEEVITDKEDHVRLAETSNEIPGVVIPQTITKITVPDTNKLAIEVTPQGEAFIREQQILDCLKKGVLEQTGLPLNSNNLFEAFGRVEGVVTTTHDLVKPIAEGGPRFVANGVPIKEAVGDDARVNVFTPLPGQKGMRVEFNKARNDDRGLGFLKSIQFENGVIVYKPETGELLVYLEHHKRAILDSRDVAGLRTSLTTDKNPDTGCEEPAINFEVLGLPDSPRAQANADAFNQSLKKLGPFQVFETESKRYILSAGEPPECRPRLQIIDKETGKILKDITGTIQQLPDGFAITDDKTGETTAIKFSEKDGVPMIQENDNPPEVLRLAQGRNGAFYYDPETGLWYAENGQILPLLEAFKQNGFGVSAQNDGSASAKAEGNVLNVDLGGGKGFDLLNLPSVPEEPLLLALFVSALVLAFVFIRRQQTG